MLLQTAFHEYKFARKFANFLFLKGEGVMSNCCKYKLREISRLLSHGDLHKIQLSRTFHQDTHLVCTTTKIVLM